MARNVLVVVIIKYYVNYYIVCRHILSYLSHNPTIIKSRSYYLLQQCVFFHATLKQYNIPLQRKKQTWITLYWMISTTTHKLRERMFQRVTILSFIDPKSWNESYSCLLSVHDKITQLWRKGESMKLVLTWYYHFPESQILAVWFLKF